MMIIDLFKTLSLTLFFFLLTLVHPHGSFLAFALGTAVHSNTAAHSSTVTLRWAADLSSGAPYAFVNPENPNETLGFEKDLMEKVAQHMGRTLVQVQNEWDSLVPGLNRGDYDVAANGIEITDNRKNEVLFSIPYYATYEEIVIKKEDHTIQSFKDLDGKKTGTLKASLAHHLLEKESKTKIIFYDDENQGFLDVIRGRIDAYFIDFPVALYYAQVESKLKLVNDPVGTLYYGIAVQKKNTALLAEINKALLTIINSGELEGILAKWNLLNPFVIQHLKLKGSQANQNHQMDLVARQQNSTLTLTDRLHRYLMLAPLLLKGAVTTLYISITAMMVAIFFGLVLTLMRLYGNAFFSVLSQGIVEILRGTPLLIQLFLIFFGLPYLGIQLSPFIAAVLGLGLNYGACEAENYRAGIEAVPHSQMEAAQALALSPFHRFRYIIFPQAYRIILPPMTNDFIALLKDSSLVSIITMVELTTLYSQLASTYFDHLGLGLVVAAIYFFIGYPFVRLARKLEKNLKQKVKRT